jgi:TRAP-type uncharacterized transport system substrate-binding protein
MKKVFIFSLAMIFGFALVMGCAPEEKAETEEKAAAEAPAKTTFVTIGTGGITGVYYPTGGAIARIMNRKKDEYGIRATVESTGGSVFNVNAVMAGDLEFGVVQSDRQYQAINGLAEWKDKGKQEDLRAVFTIHPESITLVDYKTDLTAESVKAAEAPGLLQDGRIDAFFYTVGHPSGAIKEATAGVKKVRIVPITGAGIDKLVADNPYYAKAKVPVSFYPGAQNDADVDTFGVKATFVTSAKVPENVVYAITKEVFDNFEDFKKLHPAYVVLTKANMLEGQSAQIHAGAEKYYKYSHIVQPACEAAVASRRLQVVLEDSLSAKWFYQAVYTHFVYTSAALSCIRSMLSPQPVAVCQIGIPV